MRIEILCTGDEVLTGKIVNTNFSYMAQKLEDAGLDVYWGTTVGDDREALLSAFRLASERADVVIVNGGLGPTVDDLSQEIAAQAAGVKLVLDEDWLVRMEAFFTRRGRAMSANNRKQAMLPEGSEMLDNPIGTACGFAMELGRARFFFTPGVPRELRRMLEEQIIPRLLARLGRQTAIQLKRFHTYGLGESNVDQLLDGVEAMAPDGSVKLGFRAHYPEIEAKLTVRGVDAADIARKLAPVEAEVRRRLGNFIIAEDDKSLEAVVLETLAQNGSSLTVVETFTAGGIAARLAHLPGAESVFRTDIVTRDLRQLEAILGVQTDLDTPLDEDKVTRIVRAAMGRTGATHALAVLIELDEGQDRMDLAGTTWVAVTHGDRIAIRCSRILGGREWIRLGATELGLDCLRRDLQGLPIHERTDFEKR